MCPHEAVKQGILQYWSARSSKAAARESETEVALLFANRRSNHWDRIRVGISRTFPVKGSEFRFDSHNSNSNNENNNNNNNSYNAIYNNNDNANNNNNNNTNNNNNNNNNKDDDDCNILVKAETNLV